MGIMNDLKNTNDKQRTSRVKLLDDEARRDLHQAYRQAGSRLLLLDYDGTLVSFSSEPHLAVPGEELLALISHLSSIKGNELYIISGRSRQWLQQHFGHLPVHLAAEHGACYRSSGTEWVHEAPAGEGWKTDIINCMGSYVHRCTDTFIEEKDFSVVWHYRNAVMEEGELRATELSQELAAYTGDQLQVLRGHKIVEVRQGGINKGAFVEKIRADRSFDFILAAGDDRTDEDMFRCLPGSGNIYTIKVGVGTSHARYYLSSPYMVISLLRKIVEG